MNLIVLLRLGRVSNLPTVWTNVLAGLLLSGAVPSPLTAAAVAVACSLLYVGGMYLNDAFDAAWDARERPERPIPSGQISLLAVFGIGVALLAAGLTILGVHALWHRAGAWSVVSGIGLAGVIVVYDMWHKNNPISPLLMGACRMLIYWTAALSVTGEIPRDALIGSLLLISYLIGLTYIAKQETLAEPKNLWPMLFLFAPFPYAFFAVPRYPVAGILYFGFLYWIGYAISFIVKKPRVVPRAVASLIAGISLLDALLLARQGHTAAAMLAGAGFLLTLLFQRRIAGT